MNALTIPKLPNGLTPLLSKCLDSQALAQHRALVGFELEVLAKQVDRFGWDRDRGTASHDRIVTDWMNALQDFPIDELQAACFACVIAKPDKLPNYGHVKAQILAARRDAMARQPKPVEPVEAREAPTPESKARICAVMADFNKGKAFPK